MTTILNFKALFPSLEKSQRYDENGNRYFTEDELKNYCVDMARLMGLIDKSPTIEDLRNNTVIPELKEKLSKYINQEPQNDTFIK